MKKGDPKIALFVWMQQAKALTCTIDRHVHVTTTIITGSILSHTEWDCTQRPET